MDISSVTFHPRHCRITVRFRHQLYSGQVADLGPSLLAMLPSLREHLCFNRGGLPFEEEVSDTEMGHVLEHLILELLQHHGIYARGQTTWNWNRDPIGTYHITINTGKKLAVKECLLVAQAILANALIAPPVRIVLPRPTGIVRARLPVRTDEKTLFAVVPEELET